MESTRNVRLPASIGKFILVTMGAVIGALAGAVGIEIAAETAAAAALAAEAAAEAAALEMELLGEADIVFEIGSAAAEESVITGGGAIAGDTVIEVASTSSAVIDFSPAAASTFIEGGTVANAAIAGSQVEALSLSAVGAAANSGIGVLTSPIGVSLVGFIATSGIVGFSYGVIHFALGSGEPKAVPLSPLIANAVIKGSCIEDPIDVLSGIHKCRDRRFAKVRLAIRKKRRNPVSSAKASRSSSNKSKRVRREEYSAPESREMAVKKKSVR